jgi:hypothetical protein
VKFQLEAMANSSGPSQTTVSTAGEKKKKKKKREKKLGFKPKRVGMKIKARVQLLLQLLLSGWTCLVRQM